MHVIFTYITYEESSFLYPVHFFSNNYFPHLDSLAFVSAASVGLNTSSHSN